jgi:hypothetical protein
MTIFGLSCVASQVFHFFEYSSNLNNSRFYSVLQVFTAVQHDQTLVNLPVDGELAHPTLEAQALALNQATIN